MTAPSGTDEAFASGTPEIGTPESTTDGPAGGAGVRLPLAEPPYPAATAALLTGLGQPPDGPIPPLALVRAYATHPQLAAALAPAMGGMLALIARDPGPRELLVLRVCARAAGWSEWGIHAAVARGRVGLPAELIGRTLAAATGSTAPPPATTDGANCDGAESDGADPDEAVALVIALADALHDQATVPADLWARLTTRWSTGEVLELLTIAGFYRLVAQTANALQIPAEAWAARPDSPEFQEAR